MTTDTSRDAVQDLIAEAQVITGNPFPPMSNRDATLTGRMQDTLAALLDERDSAEEKYRSWLADRNSQKERADAAEQHGAELAGAMAERDAVYREAHDTQVQRIRDLETDTQAQALTIRAVTRRAERAEAEVAELRRQHDGVQREWAHRGKRLREVANERDKLAAKLDAVKALCEKESGEIRTRYEPEGPYTGYANACDDVLAILADTDEPKESIRECTVCGEIRQAYDHPVKWETKHRHEPKGDEQ